MQGAFLRLLLVASLQLCHSRFLRHAEDVPVHDQQETCSPLTNHGTYSSVRVRVGTPPQHFDLVADTGSNNCIVMDCECAQCPQDWGKCFTGAGKSKTFELPKYKSKNPLLGSKGKFLPASTLLTFGSGQIAAHVATDEVGVGHTHAFMKNGLLLMVDQALRLQGPFEGILGLGRPEVKLSGKVNHTGGELDIHVPGYAEAAGVQRFSMCFNKEADGVLGLHTPEHPTRLESVGQIHWGVDFHGISIGEGKNRHKVKFCNPKDKQPGQETICGLIPDSGTTMITGPESQLADLYMDLCSKWPRCEKAFSEVSKEMHDLQAQGMQVGLSLTQHATVPEDLADALKKLQDAMKAGGKADPGNAADIADILGGAADVEAAKSQKDYMKANVFLLLLEHCEDWAEGVDLDKELPKLNFHVAGLNGAETELSLNPKTYIMTANAEIKVPEIKNLGGLNIQIERRKKGKVCMPAFQPAPFTTKLNGEVWIMGTPLFYEYTAHYDRGSEDGKVKPSMAFTHADEEPCGSCQNNRILRETHPSLTQKKTEKTGVESLRQLTKAPIVRNFTSTHSL
ncbi:pep2 [Symbiodinium natans]|uniref:Pep2 protein n=1 Tax=Symbiodinium natans TaxID=878477 RepID=A0A812JTD1_9DINO|nr:pep2 [Symbiodinium natans]